MKTYSDNPDRPFVICNSCLHVFDLDWDQTLDLGDMDKTDGRFQLTETNEDGEWTEVNASCPNCHTPSKYNKEYHVIHWADNSSSKMLKISELENFYLRLRISTLETQVLDLTVKKKAFARRYRRAKREAKHLADSYHIGSSTKVTEGEGEAESSFGQQKREDSRKDTGLPDFYK